MNIAKELQHLSLGTTYEIDNSFDSDKFIKMRLRVCHDQINPNRSEFNVENMEKTKDSIKNIPILANVIFDENDQPQFGGHDMAIEESKINEGEYKLIYKETPIGLVPENCNHTIEKFNDKNYVFVDCYIWKEYSNYAQDIIERDNEIKLSMEILIDSYSYNAKDKVYNITDYRYQGITFLNKDFGTGMENALATTSTFSKGNFKEKFIIMMQELKDTLTQYSNINNAIEEGGNVLDENIKELLEKFNFTFDNLPFDIEGISLEDLEIKLNEFTTENIEEVIEETNEVPKQEVFEENVVEVTELKLETEKFIKSFELSHSEIRYALYKLLSPVETEDNEWYFIDQVYDDKFEYENWEGTKIYRQRYKKDGDNVSFESERIELFQERLTQEEKAELDKMRSNYTKLQSEFNTLKSENENLINSNETLKNDNTSLLEFKSEIIKQQQEAFEAQQLQLKAELIENFSKVLSIEEIKSVEEKNLSIEDMDKEFKLMYASKELSAKFAKKPKKTDTEIPIFNFSLKKKEDWTSLIPKK